MDIGDAFSYLKRKLSCFEDVKRYESDHLQVFSIFEGHTSSDQSSKSGSTSSKGQIKPAQPQGRGRGKGGLMAPTQRSRLPRTTHARNPHPIVGSNPPVFQCDPNRSQPGHMSTACHPTMPQGPSPSFQPEWVSNAPTSIVTSGPNLPHSPSQGQGGGASIFDPASSVNHQVGLAPTISQPGSNATAPAGAQTPGAPKPPGGGSVSGKEGSAPISNPGSLVNHLVQVQQTPLTQGVSQNFFTEFVSQNFIEEPCLVCLSLGRDAYHDWRTCAVNHHLPKAFTWVGLA